MARILFVAKDNGCASVTEQVAVLAREGGHEVFIALEGLAMARYEVLGIPIYELPNYIGAVNFKEPSCPAETYAVHNFSAAEILKKIRPDLVVTGVGSPINIQRDIAEEATRRGIPLVLCEDFWSKIPGHFDIAKVKPSLVLTVDGYSAELSKPFFSGAEYHVVGNPGVKKVPVPQEVETQLHAIRDEGFERLYIFAGGGASATNELSLLLQCLEQTSGRWCIIPRFHPKVAQWTVPGEHRTYGELWKEFLKPFSEHVRYVEAPSTDPIAVAPSADVLVSGFSTLMTTAAHYRKQVICLKTPETIASLKAHGGHYTEIPQVALGLASEVTKPTDLSQFGMPSVEALKKLVPYDAELAYKYICALL